MHVSKQIREQGKEPVGVCLGLFFFICNSLEEPTHGMVNTLIHIRSGRSFLLSKPSVEMYSKACL